MKSIRVCNVSKSYQGEAILSNLSLTIESGKFFALLGPSGSGKTTLLRLIGGFETVDSGSIFLGDEDITHKPINKRRINTVFQNYALFPHMTVFDNVAYSQVLKKVDPALIREKVYRILRSMHLEAHAHKSVTLLSGGQQQRVALARAIINEPDVLLLDEPLAALDLKLRERVLLELIELQDTLKTTFIYITHDQFEALTVADQMAIMNHDGEIEQIGTPKEIYEYPETSFVARFVGTTNILKGQLLQLHEHEALVDIAGLGVVAVTIQQAKPWMVQGKQVVVSVRPEKLVISTSERVGFANAQQGSVEALIYYGRSTQYNVRLANGQLVQVFEQNEEHVPQQVIDYDSKVWIYFHKENAVLLQR